MACNIDVVYPLKRGGPYEELKYSLRSLQNLPHRNVYVIGGKPSWLTGAIHLEGTPGKSKYDDAGSNIRTACEHPDVSDPFILMNDDFFVMRPMDEVPVLNRGLSTDVEAELLRSVGQSNYQRGMTKTREVLERLGYEDVLCFSLHVPIVVHKRMFLKAQEIGSELPAWHARTAYGALAMLKGETVPDVKARNRKDPMPDNTEFVSTSDNAFKYGPAGRAIRQKFPDKSPYEL